MADRWAVFIGIDKHSHADFAPTPFAEADCKALAATLVTHAIPPERRIMLLGSFATKTAIESRLRKLRKLIKKGDELLIVWAGRAFTHADATHLLAWDTLPDDRSETAIAFADFFAALHATKASQLTLLLSLGHTGADLTKLFAESARAVGLLAAAPEEEPLSTPTIKQSVWMQLIGEAFAGTARKAIEPSGVVTAVSLQRFVEDELPRRLRKHFESGVRQTPQLLGEQNAAAVIVTHTTRVADEATLDAGRLRRVVFRSEISTKVKELTNFRKTFTIPDAASPANRKFVARIATDDIKVELDRVFEACREELGYKRKDIDVTVGQDGVGHLRTPDFEYTIVVDLDTNEPSRLIWRHEASRFTNPDFVRSVAFQQVLGPRFENLVFEFAKPFDVGGFIDRLEDTPIDGLKLRVDSDAKSCEIVLHGFPGTVVVKRHSLSIGGRAANASGLLDVLLQFFAKVGPLGEPRLLKE